MTSFNGLVAPRRRLAFASIATEDVRKLKHAMGTKYNDSCLAVAVAVAGGAVRSYLLDRGELPKDPLVAAVPVSTQVQTEGAGANEVADMWVNLGLNITLMSYGERVDFGITVDPPTHVEDAFAEPTQAKKHTAVAKPRAKKAAQPA